MNQNIIEYARRLSVENLFRTNTFDKTWNIWKDKIISIANNMTPNQILDLGDHLAEVFKTTSNGRSQSDVSSGGNTWESLVCWYLNLCLIGRRTIVIKHHKDLIPTPVSNAITVDYSNFVSNTESDLIAITFPDKEEYQISKDDISIKDANGNDVPTYKNNHRNYNYLEIINALTHRDFSQLEIHIIQCKTNWNDNAQIPMLWNMIYSARGFKEGNISIGRNNLSIHNIKRFTYSFVTVPTVRTERIKPTSTQVKRVINLTGGNYWGHPSKSGIANSIKEMLNKNLLSGYNENHLNTLKNEIDKLDTEYDYFRL
jgi:hypothetical protein